MKKTGRKLALSTETVRLLESEQLARVAGGTSGACLIGPVTTSHPASQVLGGCKLPTSDCNFNSLSCGYGF
jgi:hypothetical protein